MARYVVLLGFKYRKEGLVSVLAETNINSQFIEYQRAGTAPESVMVYRSPSVQYARR